LVTSKKSREPVKKVGNHCPGDLKSHRDFYFNLRRVRHIETIGSRIKLIRKINKVNQIEFSNQIGISQATLSELEQDKYRPSVDTIIAIVKAFESNSEWLLFGSENNIVKNQIFGLTKIEEKEVDLISFFRKLKNADQDEIIEFIRMKIKRY
jgi:transcriptional regulator with XRE-family HTH domain